MKKIKLLVVTPYFTPHLGGMEKHVFTICKGLMKEYNYEIIVITSNHESKEYKEEKLEGMKIYRFPYQFKVSNTPISFKWKRQIKEIIEKEKPDIINGRGPVPLIADIACRIAHKKGIPFVLGWHFPSMRKGQLIQDIIISIYENTLFQKTLRQSDKIICSSQFVKDTLLKEYSKKTTVITQGINNKIFLPLKNIKPKDNSLLFVGNFETKVKGLSYLLKSIKFVKESFKNVKLSIVGTGDLSYYKRICRKLNISYNIIFKGKLEGINLAKEYQSSQIFISPSTAENLPSTILEAMFCKVPVISTNIGDIPNWIKSGENGLLVHPKNSQALAYALIRLLNNPRLAKRIGREGYLSIKDSFYWRDRIKKTNEIFNSLLKK